MLRYGSLLFCAFFVWGTLAAVASAQPADPSVQSEPDTLATRLPDLEVTP